VPISPLFDHKNSDAPSVFAPAALLREARRQKGLPAVDVPRICLPNPDGDLVHRLQKHGAGEPVRGLGRLSYPA
jgi:hypothetical protein